MANVLKPKTLKGFKDILPQEALVKTQMLDTLRGVFRTYGFVPIETPHLEYTEMLVQETAEDEVGKQLYRFEDNGGRDVCLRFDLTVPFARYVVQHRQELGIPFKRYAIANVFRGEQPQFGRYREFTQCDFDIVGCETGGADAEVVQVIAAALQALGLKRFVIRVNNRKVMNGLASALGVSDAAIPEMLRIMDKFDKIGTASVQEQLQSALSVSLEVAQQLVSFATLSAGTPNELLKQAAPYKEKSELLAVGLQELEDLFAILQSIEAIQENIAIDFTIARGLGYYTGIVYETTLSDMPEIGSVCSGGRYDNLTQNFSKDPLPGVGASVGLDRLIAALIKQELVAEQRSSTELLCLIMDKALTASVHAMAHSIRKKGVVTEVYPEAAKLKKQFQYADRNGIPFVLIMGEEEFAHNTFTMKNLQTGEQESFSSLDEVLSKMKAASVDV